MEVAVVENPDDAAEENRGAEGATPWLSHRKLENTGEDASAFIPISPSCLRNKYKYYSVDLIITSLQI